MSENNMRKNRWSKKLSLGTRLKLIVILSLVPLTFLIGYLIYVLNDSVQTFARTANSVNYASRYATEFKERMDYSVYYSIIFGEKYTDLEKGVYSVGGLELVNPYEYIDELREACNEMRDIATVRSNTYLPRRINNSLNALLNIVKQIDQNVSGQKSYDENVDLLEDVRNLTNLIETNIQQYINDENANFARVREKMMENTRTTFQISIVIVLSVAVLATILSTLTFRSIVRPIQKLCDMSKRVAKGDFSARTSLEAGDEISTLTDNFNDMTEEIGELVEGIKKEQNNLRLLETKLLQAQINPHFLYNTLDTIVWLAEAGQKEEVVKMVSRLSEFFRTTLSKGRDYITIEEESRHVESYLQIQKFRYQDIMDYKINMAEDILEYTVPKLTLQPLVENALYHGIKNKRGGGTILIEGAKRGDRIFLKVIDNGKGMTERELEGLRRYIAGCGAECDGGFGLANVNERIHHYYGGEYGIFFESEENVGTEAVIIIPAKNIEQRS